MQEQKLERITPAQAGLDPQCIINMMDRMEKEHINITSFMSVSYTHLRAHETLATLVCRLLLE